MVDDLCPHGGGGDSGVEQLERSDCLGGADLAPRRVGVPVAVGGDEAIAQAAVGEGGVATAVARQGSKVLAVIGCGV